MKRDMELVKMILLLAEAHENSTVYLDEIEGYDEKVVEHHEFILKDAGFIIYDEKVRSIRLTWSGYDYLDKVRDQSVFHAG
jgi:hypothetical protein